MRELKTLFIAALIMLMTACQPSTTADKIAKLEKNFRK